MKLLLCGLFFSSMLAGTLSAQFVVKQGTEEYMRVDSQTGEVQVLNHLSTESFQMKSGAGDSRIMVSDAQGNALWRERIYVRAYRDQPQDIINITDVIIKFNVLEPFSTSGVYETSTGKFIAPRTGIYLISSTVHCETGTNNLSAKVAVYDENDVQQHHYRGTTYQNQAEGLTGAHISASVYLRAGWKAAIRVFHNSGEIKSLAQGGEWFNTNWVSIAER